MVSGARVCLRFLPLVAENFTEPEVVMPSAREAVLAMDADGPIARLLERATACFVLDENFGHQFVQVQFAECVARP